ncbi:hypothetical protein PR202_ga20781 [Eleusine coracana subsp. coracana]|uniref:Uncharacterized protein n=1 Tax=Eleusine coracana subsp. coracana TaxID=191504 RepID=A0AAV5CYY5_ELECO|nr:hypothetical protein PR202_ga20781 [Eleusine coracana subsp. coracana]
MSSSQLLLRRLVALASGRVRANHRLLSSAVSSPIAVTTERVSQSPPETETGAVRMTEGCIRKLVDVLVSNILSLDDKLNADDRVFESDGAKLVVNDISYNFVKGATVDYEEELIRSAIVVSLNFGSSFFSLNILLTHLR